MRRLIDVLSAQEIELILKRDVDNKTWCNDNKINYDHPNVSLALNKLVYGFRNL